MTKTILAVLIACATAASMDPNALTSSDTQVRPQVPIFRVDAMWPKPLPNRWTVGAVVGVAVDAKDHVWITHRPSTLQPNETRSVWRAAPPVLEFDPEGNLVPDDGHRRSAANDRPALLVVLPTAGGFMI